MEKLTELQLKRLNSTYDREFLRGVAWALGTLNTMHDQPTMCADVLRELRCYEFPNVPTNVTMRARLAAAGVGEYDMAALGPVLRQLKSTTK